MHEARGARATEFLMSKKGKDNDPDWVHPASQDEPGVRTRKPRTKLLKEAEPELQLLGNTTNLVAGEVAGLLNSGRENKDKLLGKQVSDKMGRMRRMGMIKPTKENSVTRTTSGIRAARGGDGISLRPH